MRADAAHQLVIVPLVNDDDVRIVERFIEIEGREVVARR